MKFAFVGNRRFVLEEMLLRKLNITSIFVIDGTHLKSDITHMNVDYQVVASRKELVGLLEKDDFDTLVSNGCPYILPISRMKKKRYVNIHPSFLPDLRGQDPVIGSILFQRPGGATCHLMNDKIDAGDIISQVKIPYSEDLDVSLMYQLSFIAEKQAFNLAYDKNFTVDKVQTKSQTDIYFSRDDEDRRINFSESNDQIIRKVRAFSNKSQGCELRIESTAYKIHQVEILTNPFLVEHASLYDDLCVILNYENCIIFKKDNEILLFRSLTDNLSELGVGSILSVL